MVAAYLTPDDEGGVYLSRRLRFRSELAGFVTSVLESLTNPYLWEESGDMSPTEVASLALESLNYYLDSQGAMIGTLVQYITENPPDGVLPLDGSTYNNVNYPELSAVLDPVWDNGDGTFTLPDARGRTIIATGTGEGLTLRSMGDSIGEEEHQLGTNEMPSHDHVYSEPDITTIAGYVGSTPGQVPWPAPSVTGSAGSNQAHNTMQPSLAVHMGVWFK